jgi:hypothetical protein
MLADAGGVIEKAHQQALLVAHTLLKAYRRTWIANPARRAYTQAWPTSTVKGEHGPMNFPLSYCPDGYFVLERLKRLYEQRDQTIVLASMEIPSAALQAMARQHPPGFCEYPDPHERARYWDAHLREKITVHDDVIPNAYLTEMDQGLYGGLVGGQARFLCDPETGWISSMVAPLIKDWTELEGLPQFDPADRDNAWLQRYLRQMEVFKEVARDKWSISHFILIDSLNFGFELVGATETYIAVIEHPELVRRVIDFAFDLNVKVQRIFFQQVLLLEGGTCSNFAQWLPGRVVSESVDPFHMTSVDFFEQWGRAPVERMLAAFDGGVIHIHGNGRHLLRAVSTVKGLRALLLADDRGWPLAFDILPQVRQQVGDLPLIIYGVEYDKFYQALQEHRLVGGVFYNVTEVPDADTANRCMEQVRRYAAG